MVGGAGQSVQPLFYAHPKEGIKKGRREREREKEKKNVRLRRKKKELC